MTPSRLCKISFPKPGKSGKLALVGSNFSGLLKAITRLETVGMELSDATEYCKTNWEWFKVSKGKVTEKNSDTLQRMLQSNQSCSTLCKISNIPSGLKTKFEDLEPEFSLEEFAFFKFAPRTSCDVEQSFSRCKTTEVLSLIASRCTWSSNSILNPEVTILFSKCSFDSFHTSTSALEMKNKPFNLCVHKHRFLKIRC